MPVRSSYEPLGRVPSNLTTPECEHRLKELAALDRAYAHEGHGKYSARRQSVADRVEVLKSIIVRNRQVSIPGVE